MEIFLPDNIFSRILSSCFQEHDAFKQHYIPSGLLSKELERMKDAIGLIPTMDLLYHNELYISKSFGISFDESISNSYIYFQQKEKTVNEIVLAGDVSTNEGILTKILFSELYNVDITISFEKTNGDSLNKNRVLVGDRNFVEGNLDSAISFTEEIIELISVPYVNFVVASKSEDTLKKFHSDYHEIISLLNPQKICTKMASNFALSSKNYLHENLQHVMFNFDEQDLEGIKQLLEFPYLHGIIDNMIDVEFV